ncbi:MULTISPECIES: TetR/AcrR family transcriptional regulator [Caballeronia]|uniref:TetR/AcrR family transcriptional regulator n=1 Tax=Caballeronia TaxID=1827195 RepID=UPI001FD2D6FA|nr:MULTISPECIES: TetR/AcrR family transcriptional regulator [Caballeronia]MDR5799125.1 TetR/AcrR family transcriptional regulator [Caballeronia sp. LZ001]
MKSNIESLSRSKERPVDPDFFLRRIHLDSLENADYSVPDGTRGQLMVEAIKVFASLGYDACSMRDLAKAVHVGAPAIYNHFGSKVELLIAATDHVLSVFFKSVLGDLEQSSAKDILFEILRRHCLFCTTQRTWDRAAVALLNDEFMSRTLPADVKKRFETAVREYIKIIEELIDAQVGKDPLIDSETRAFMVYQIADHSGERFDPKRGSSPEEVARQCCELARRVICAP